MTVTFEVPDELHPETAGLIARFATALAEKARASEIKYGFRDSWARPDWEKRCQRELMEHVKKGDPRDVAMYSAFCFHHGWSTNAHPCVTCDNAGWVIYYVDLVPHIARCYTCQHIGRGSAAVLKEAPRPIPALSPEFKELLRAAINGSLPIHLELAHNLTTVNANSYVIGAIGAYVFGDVDEGVKRLALALAAWNALRFAHG